MSWEKHANIALRVEPRRVGLANKKLMHVVVRRATKMQQLVGGPAHAIADKHLMSPTAVRRAASATTRSAFATAYFTPCVTNYLKPIVPRDDIVHYKLLAKCPRKTQPR